MDNNLDSNHDNKIGVATIDKVEYYIDKDTTQFYRSDRTDFSYKKGSWSALPFYSGAVVTIGAAISKSFFKGNNFVLNTIILIVVLLVAIFCTLYWYKVLKGSFKKDNRHFIPIEMTTADKIKMIERTLNSKGGRTILIMLIVFFLFVLVFALLFFASSLINWLVCFALLLFCIGVLLPFYVIALDRNKELRAKLKQF